MDIMFESRDGYSGKQVGRYLFTHLLGCGAAANVYQAVDVTLVDSPTFAIKCVQQSYDHQRAYQQIQEIANHDTVAGCPHVMTLLDCFEEDGYIFLVFRLCETDMFRAIWKDNVYWRNDALIKEVFIDILDGVFACHKKGVFHRDLKPENIMCNVDGKDIMISDFGLSSNRRVCRDGGCGTLSYMGPECLNKKTLFYYGEAADIWSLGVILFNMVTCHYPWKVARRTDKEYIAFMTDCGYLDRTWPISESLSLLLDRMWHPIPQRRMPIPAIREAILNMDTFYKPRRPDACRWTSLLSKEVALAALESQETYPVPVRNTQKKDVCGPGDTPKEVLLIELNSMFKDE